MWIFRMSESFAKDSPKRFTKRFTKDSPELNLSNIWIFCKNSEVSRIFKTFERFGKKFWVESFECPNLCKCDKYSKDLPMWIFLMSESFANVKIISNIHQSWIFRISESFPKIVKLAGYSKHSKDSGKNLSRIFWMSESFAMWQIFKRFANANLSNIWIFCKCENYFKDSPELNLSNIWIFCKNGEVSRIFKTFERFGKKFESNLLNVLIFCKSDKYSKDSPMRIFRMSESFANVKIISKIHQSWIFRISKNSEVSRTFKTFERFRKKFESNLLNVRIFCKCENYFKDSPELNLSNIWIFCKNSEVSSIFKTFERFGKKFWVESFECPNLCKCEKYSKDSPMRIFLMWIFCKCENYFKHSPELNLSNIWIFSKNSEVSRIFKTFERFGKKFESNLLNVRIFCKCDKYSKDSPMRIFRMSESFAKVKIISKIHQSWIFRISESFAKIVKLAGYSKHSKDSGKNFELNLLNVRIFANVTNIQKICQCESF